MNKAFSHSLRTRLLSFLLLAILLTALIQALSAYQGALRQADAMFDDHLQQTARSLRSGVLPGLPLAEGEDGSGFDLYVQIWGQDGTQIFRSSRSALPPRAVLGFSDVEANGTRYRVYTLQTPLQTVQIAQDLSARTARARALALQAVLPFAWLTPLLMLAVWWIISRSLAPIERARRQVAGRAADDLSPLTDSGRTSSGRPLSASGEKSSAARSATWRRARSMGASERLMIHQTASISSGVSRAKGSTARNASALARAVRALRSCAICTVCKDV